MSRNGKAMCASRAAQEEIPIAKVGHLVLLFARITHSIGPFKVCRTKSTNYRRYYRPGMMPKMVG